MKKIIAFAITCMMAATMVAQTSLVATLTHGDSITMYYGAFALQNAHAAAANGDIINLSGGTFQSVTITKGLTIRGTGIEDANPTIIVGNFDINIASNVTDRLSFEGCRISNQITVKGTLTNAYFLKDYIQDVYVYGSNANMVNGMFANCQVYQMNLYGSSTVQFINSHVEGFYNNAEKTASASFVNCVIVPRNGCMADCIGSSQLVNCILCWTRNTAYSLPSTSSAINCVAVGDGSTSCFEKLASKQNCKYAGLDIFTDSNMWNDLTDDAKTKYLGNDGTSVGMYGGILPYDMTPSYPQITKMNVANKTTADGKLSVEIEVSAAK